MSTSATIRRWQWLLVLPAIGLIVVLPVLSTSNTCLLPVESSESLSDGEDCEFDESLNLFARLSCRTGLLSPGYHEAVADESASACLLLAAIHFERGPPVC